MFLLLLNEILYWLIITVSMHFIYCSLYSISLKLQLTVHADVNRFHCKYISKNYAIEFTFQNILLLRVYSKLKYEEEWVTLNMNKLTITFFGLCFGILLNYYWHHVWVTYEEISEKTHDLFIGRNHLVLNTYYCRYFFYWSYLVFLSDSMSSPFSTFC